MADIAILVAEEYERRLKNSRKANSSSSSSAAAAANGGFEISLVSCVSSVSQSIKNKVRQDNIEQLIAKWVLEPKTQIGLAASNGFFSA